MFAIWDQKQGFPRYVNDGDTYITWSTYSVSNVFEKVYHWRSCSTAARREYLIGSPSLRLNRIPMRAFPFMHWNWIRKSEITFTFFSQWNCKILPTCELKGLHMTHCLVTMVVNTFTQLDHYERLVNHSLLLYFTQVCSLCWSINQERVVQCRYSHYVLAFAMYSATVTVSTVTCV